jgi:hypothetical protein
MNYLKPHRLKSIKNQPIVIAAYIEKYLRLKGGESKVNDLVSHLKKELNIPEKEISLGINFLYILLKIDYDKERDILFRKNHEVL